MKRLIGLQGDWVSNPETQDMTRIPDGKCWVEGDNAAASSDSREYGAVSSDYRHPSFVALIVKPLFSRRVLFRRWENTFDQVDYGLL